MKEIYNRLLRLALTVGLTEREAFVDKVSEVIARIGRPGRMLRVLPDAVRISIDRGCSS